MPHTSQTVNIFFSNTLENERLIYLQIVGGVGAEMETFFI